MAKPLNKTQLLEQGEKERDKLLAYLDGLTPEQKIQPGIVGEWSVKDVLAHLTEWHEMVLRWWAAGQRGETPAVPAEGYNWRTLPDLNQMIYEKHRQRPLDEVEAGFTKSEQDTRSCIESLSEEELFTAGLQDWMNKNTLAAYFNSSTASHYRWALKEIRKGIKALQQSQ